MARLNDNNPPYKAPVPNTDSPQRSTLEARKANKMIGTGVAKRVEKVAVPATSSGQKSPGMHTQFNSSGSKMASSAQMFPDGRIVEADSSVNDDDSDEEDEEGDLAMGGVERRRSFVEEGDDVQEEIEASIRTQIQTQEKETSNSPANKAPLAPKKQGLMSMNAELQSPQQLHGEKPAHLENPSKDKASTGLNKARLMHNMPAENERPHGRGRPRKSIVRTAMPARQEEIMVSSKQYPKPSERSEASTENTEDKPPRGRGRLRKSIVGVEKTPPQQEETVAASTEHPKSSSRPNALVKQTVPAVKDEEVEGEDVEEDDEPETYVPRAVKGSRKDNAGNEEIIVEWEGYPLEKDWTWESTETLRESCPDFITEWENEPQKAGKNTFVVERIVKKQAQHDGKIEYYVKWEGYTDSDNTWEPAEMLEHDIPQMVDEFEEKYQKKMGKNGIARKVASDAIQPEAKRSRGRPRKSE